MLTSLKAAKLSKMQDAIRILLEMPVGAFIAKSNIGDAYRLIPLNPTKYPKLEIKFQGRYYYDTFLPQGCGSSCRIF